MQMDVLHGDINILTHVEGIFDLIVANINRNILLEDMEHLHNVLAIGGTLIISGFYEEDAPILLEKAATFGWHDVGRKTDNNWCCLVLG
jgi:ribosomal protein L11 methyltransferase